MANIKETGFLSCPLVTFSDTQVRVLDRHGIAGEGNHLRAVVDMQIMERCPVEGAGVRGACRRRSVWKYGPRGWAEGKSCARIGPCWDCVVS